ncbi:hypothetical protein B0H17DRAFT_1130670 [Mycena rosella]|uniref:Uncharacterized protein n=1 Tax=Mycena rosella TaxID=1033263 RepID=A0AAD7DQX8_MYCRO|nr:hypothetical protein B0H17DRAFT_1130670 [Mycena rosella]
MRLCGLAFSDRERGAQSVRTHTTARRRLSRSRMHNLFDWYAISTPFYIHSDALLLEYGVMCLPPVDGQEENEISGERSELAGHRNRRSAGMKLAGCAEMVRVCSARQGAENQSGSEFDSSLLIVRGERASGCCRESAGRRVSRSSHCDTDTENSTDLAVLEHPTSPPCWGELDPGVSPPCHLITAFSGPLAEATWSFGDLRGALSEVSARRLYAAT